MEVFQYSRAPVALAEHGHEGLTIDPILAIHRGQDAYVTFHVIENGEMVTDCAVKVASLESLFPQFRAELERDAYYSLNAFYRHGFYGIGLAGLPRAFRSGSGARYLNACFVDIDCYKAAIAPGTMAGYVLTLQATGIIPYVSVIVRSGQGLWAMWLLVDAPNTNLPPTAHAPRLLLWKRLQQELVKRFAGFKVDRAATDVARITRIPGSINSKSGTRVQYLFQASADGRVHVYTMGQLASFLNISPPVQRQSKDPGMARPTKSEERSERAMHGFEAMARYRLEDFLRLRELRGAFRRGTRNNAAFVYAWILRANRFEEETIESEVARLGRECLPPLNPREVRGVIEQSKKERRLEDQTIADKLDVTPAEAELVPRFASIVPPGIATVVVSAAERRRVIRDILDSAGRRLPCRHIAVLLANRGIAATAMTVSRDMKHLSNTPVPASLQTCLPLTPSLSIYA